MKIYNVGNDELNEYDLQNIQDDKYKWLVYWYENGGYDGWGEAVALSKDDKIYCKNLGHCSCYGPMEEWKSGCTVMTIEEFLKDKEDIFEYDCKDAIKQKVRRLTAHLRKK